MKYADYIEQIEIDSLWSGKKHIIWDLDRRVNILSGINGVGKSTIINKVVKSVCMNGDVQNHLLKGVHVKTNPADATHIRFDVIRSFDRPILNAETVNKMDISLATELDWQLYQLQRRYLDYQVNQSNRIVALFTAADPEAQQKAAAIASEKNHFQDLVDELFLATGKRIDRSSNEIFFHQMDERLTPYLLSSGEKQMLIILLTVLVENREPYVLLMDEPEVSLHVEWQQRLLELIMDLNPNVQIILSTHSPAVIMSGWTDRVTDVEDIIV